MMSEESQPLIDNESSEEDQSSESPSEMSDLMSLRPSSDEMDESAVRIVLLGKTGSGKSATGNTILIRKAFTEQCSPESTTKICRKEKNEVNGRLISVIDTPGLCDTSMSPEEVKREIEKCVYMSVPGPHVFLLVIRLGVKITEEEQNTVKWIQKNFGEDASMYTIIVFTFRDSVKGKTADKYIRASKYLRKLINSCGNRYTFLNNEDPDNRTQVDELVQKIHDLIQENGGKCYTNAMYEEAQEKMRQEEERRKEEERKRIIEEYNRSKSELWDKGVEWVRSGIKKAAKAGTGIKVGGTCGTFGASVLGITGVLASMPALCIAAPFIFIACPVIGAVACVFFHKIKND